MKKQCIELPPSSWEKIVEHHPSGNLAPLVLSLVIAQGASIHDVFSMREVCSKWKRIIDANDAYWNLMCIHLKCERSLCSFYSLYGITDGHLLAVWDLVSDWQEDSIELVTRIVQAYLGWAKGRIWKMNDVKEPMIGEYPYRTFDSDAVMLCFQGMLIAPVMHEFFFCRGQTILHRTGRAFAWRTITISNLVRPYLLYVNK